MSLRYVVIQRGVYRHSVIGVWDDLALAKMGAEAAIAAEHDDYHQMEVVAVPANVLAEEEVVAVLYRKMKGNQVIKQWWEQPPANPFT